MRIQCLNCGSGTFEIELSSADLDRAPVVALNCARCGKWTAVQRRPGGGIQIALDQVSNGPAPKD